MRKRFAPPPTTFGAVTPAPYRQPGHGGPSAQLKQVQLKPTPGGGAVRHAPPPLAPIRSAAAGPAVVPTPSKPAIPARPSAGAVQRMQSTSIDMDLGYESHGASGASEDEAESLGVRKGKGGIKGSNVHKHYRKKKPIWRRKAREAGGIKLSTSTLEQLVRDFDTGTPGANTHIVMINGVKATLYQANTANGVRLEARKLKYQSTRIDVSPSSSRNYHKLSNVHTEMSVLYRTTGGDVKKVRGALAGKPVVVDKACCRMCYYWMKAAGATVYDGTSFNATDGTSRAAFDWTNPFDRKRFGKKAIADMSTAALSEYVNAQIRGTG